MNFLDKFKFFLKKKDFLLVKPLKKLNAYINRNYISDEKYLKSKFKRIFGYSLDLDNPKTINEKIQWLKLYDRKDFYTDLVDKYKVRDFVKNKIGENYLIPLLFVTDDLRKLNSDILPDYPVIIKSTHDSGSFKIVKDKKSVDWCSVQLFFKERLKINYYWPNRELPYKSVKPQIIVEKLLINSDKKPLLDYKFFCMDGKVNYVACSSYNDKGVKEFGYFDKNFDKLGLITWGFDEKNEGKAIMVNCDKPLLFDSMISVAEKLSEGFIMVRVDLYENNGLIYFGEMTLHPGGGFHKCFPEKFDHIMGEKINLPS